MRFTYFFKFLSSKRKKPFHIEISFPLLYFDTIDRLSITKNFATLEEVDYNEVVYSIKIFLIL